jgi:hypothetical protein
MRMVACPAVTLPVVLGCYSVLFENPAADIRDVASR